MKTLIGFVVVATFVGALHAASLNNKPLPSKMPKAGALDFDLGFPVIGKLDSTTQDDEENKKDVVIYRGIILVLREDGTIGWKLSPALAKRFEEEMREDKPKLFPRRKPRKTP